MWVCEHTDPKYLSLAINEAQGNVGLVSIHMQSVWAWQAVKPMVTWDGKHVKPKVLGHTMSKAICLIVDDSL